MDRIEAIEMAEESDHCIRPAEAFSLLGNETRIKILETLWKAEEQPVPFSRLYEAADVTNSSKFNYHLGKLLGQYIRKTDGGYELRTAGKSVVGMIVKGSFNAHPQPDPFEVDEPCTKCSGQLMARYENEMLAIECSSCDRGHGRYSFPPGGMLGRDNDELLTVFDRRVRHLLNLAQDGVCPECSGKIRSMIEMGEIETHDAEISVRFVCQQCNHTLQAPIGFTLLNRSPVVTFYRDHGLELADRRYWRLPWCVSDDCTTIRSVTPHSFDVALTLDSETLCITLDRDLNLIRTRRIAL
ncbi:winged helix-turn-helix domain-containing protein [Natrinema ejinorense]|uniref:winged helix-turn-helix domain-containing protein n=1 Tax=Natrinema ejinorense TaxID=373386 RepID=UPI001FE54EF5|nr:helix-turn-helix domain-containing protein [Natrinema ejinorense]